MAAGAAGAVVAVVWFGLSWRDGRRWEAYLERLRAESGLVVLDAARRGRTFTITGLRDPLASDPRSFLAAAGVPGDRVVDRWQWYQSADAPIVRARATSVLRPPAGVELHVSDNVLGASGPVLPAWAYEAARLGPMIAGVRAVDPDLVPAAERALRARVEAATITFVRGRADVAPGQDDAVGEVLDLFRHLDAAARGRGAPIEVRIVGHTDSDGPDGLNLPLSQARAAAVRARIEALGLPGVRLATDGVGSAQPRSPGLSDDDKQRNRRVSFVVVSGLAAAPARQQP
jgi:OOP family OmpA-OmpF porin